MDAGDDMETGDELLLQLPVPCEPDAPASVRRALEGLLADDWIAGDVMLVASELVTRVLGHPRSSARATLTVEVARREDRLIVTVTGPAHPGGPPGAGMTGPGFDPLGLRLVEQLVQNWGEECGDPYAVWAEFATPSPAQGDLGWA